MKVIDLIEQLYLLRKDDMPKDALIVALGQQVFNQLLHELTTEPEWLEPPFKLRLRNFVIVCAQKGDPYNVFLKAMWKKWKDQ